MFDAIWIKFSFILDFISVNLSFEKEIAIRTELVAISAVCFAKLAENRLSLQI